MKPITLLLLSLFFLNSCKKESVYSLRSQFSGKWEYETFSGYPFNAPTLPRGNGKIIVIGQDGSFERRNFDTIIFKGRYYLDERKDCYGDNKLIFFKTNDPSFGEELSIHRQGDRLFLSTSHCLADGGILYYRKL